MRPAADRRTLVRTLDFCAIAALAILLPCSMILANRSAPVCLAVAAVAANAAVCLSGRTAALKARYRRLAADPGTLLVVIALAVAALSMAWSISPQTTARGLAEATPELVFGLAAGAAFPLVMRPRRPALLGVGIVLAALLVIACVGTQMAPQKFLGERGAIFDIKRSCVPMALLAWGLFGDPAPHGRRLGKVLATTGAALIAAAFAHSGTTVLALLLGAIVYGLARRWPAVTRAGVATALCILILTAPFAGSVAGRLPGFLLGALRQHHASERILIWQAYGRSIRSRPIAGHGFFTSAALAGSSELPEEDAGLANTHPHDAFLQVWVEFGCLGGLFGLLCVGYLTRRLRAMPRDAAAQRLALVAAMTGVGMVGLGAWQAWWLATIAAAWILCADAAGSGTAGAPARRDDP